VSINSLRNKGALTWQFQIFYCIILSVWYTPNYPCMDYLYADFINCLHKKSIKWMYNEEVVSVHLHVSSSNLLDRFKKMCYLGFTLKVVCKLSFWFILVKSIKPYKTKTMVEEEEEWSDITTIVHDTHIYIFFFFFFYFLRKPPYEISVHSTRLRLRSAMFIRNIF
jgi:hypothetical protein